MTDVRMKDLSEFAADEFSPRARDVLDDRKGERPGPTRCPGARWLCAPSRNGTIAGRGSSNPAQLHTAARMRRNRHRRPGSRSKTATISDKRTAIPCRAERGRAKASKVWTCSRCRPSGWNAPAREGRMGHNPGFVAHSGLKLRCVHSVYFSVAIPGGNEGDIAAIG